ncbi:MFS transporter [Arthrobacter globiformis]|uniref:MFS transporter n=1 Tax=Arthrobacter globiformis TaxID=1665 RepID=UPI000B4173E5|nr:MFS transporter [Arthrobacter globiformis]
MTLSASKTGTANRVPWRVSIASFAGTTIEWYDYYIFGLLAATGVFSRLYFPEQDPATGLLLAFLTYAVGFVARPFGGMFAGHYGDKIGRKPMLVLSLLLMGFATLAMGLLPAYAQIGVWAPILLTVLRLMQGFGAGAEWAGAAIISTEHAPEGRRGFFGSFTQMGVPAGMLLANASVLAVKGSVPADVFDAWAWRIPFLLSVLLIVVGLVVRAKLEDSEDFKDLIAKKQTAHNPLGEALKKETKGVWLVVGMRLAENSAFYLYTTFSVVYIMRTFGPERANQGSMSVLIASAIGVIAVPLWAALSDRIGRKPLYLFGSIGGLLFFPLYFVMTDTGSALLATLAIIIGLAVFHNSMYGPQAAFFAELFSTKLRYSGASMGYQFGSVLAGGIAPLVAVALLNAGNGEPGWVILYFSVIGVITVVSAILAPETVKRVRGRLEAAERMDSVAAEDAADKAGVR